MEACEKAIELSTQDLLSFSDENLQQLGEYMVMPPNIGRQELAELIAITLISKNWNKHNAEMPGMQELISARIFYKTDGKPSEYLEQIEINTEKLSYRFYIAEGGTRKQAGGFSETEFQKTRIYKNAPAKTMFLDMRCLKEEESTIAKRYNYQIMSAFFEYARERLEKNGISNIVFFCVSGINRSVTTSVFFAICTYLLAIKKPPVFRWIIDGESVYEEEYDIQKRTYQDFVLSFIAILPRGTGVTKKTPFVTRAYYIKTGNITAENRELDKTDYFQLWSARPESKEIINSMWKYLADKIKNPADIQVPPSIEDILY